MPDELHDLVTPSVPTDWVRQVTKPARTGRPAGPKNQGSKVGRKSYEEYKAQISAHQNKVRAAARDMARPLSRHNPERYERARMSFRVFCEEYLPATFALGWSPDHLRVIAKIEAAVLHGELLAIAMARGSGKTSLIIAAAEWALLYAHRKFVTIIGSDEPSAENMLDSIITDFETNDILLGDFPEVLYPVRCLEGIRHRAGGQTWRGEPTRSEWTQKQVVLPTVRCHLEDDLSMGGEPGAYYPACGGVLDVAGITGRLRGRQRKTAEGKTIRPDLVLLDDPQSDESARSPAQVQTRMRTLNGAILGLAGPGKKIAGLCTVTVICPGDLADLILDSKRYPQWQGERTKLLYDYPVNTALWERYAALRVEGLRSGEGLAPATEFYRQNRAAMDEGARAGWEDRFNPDEISAIQNAMNLKLQDEVAFMAEYQNDPMPLVAETGAELRPGEVAQRVNRTARGVIPQGVTRLTAFIDVQQKGLFWVLCGFTDEMGACVVDYGTFPEQGRPYFSLADMRKTLSDTFPGQTLEAQIYQALKALVGDIATSNFDVEDGATLRCERILVDANWGLSTDTVYRFCKESQWAPVVTPSHGRYVGAAGKPFAELPKKPGDRVGMNWRMPATGANGKRNVVRYVLYDTNYWKSTVAVALTVPMGSNNACTLFGDDPEAHRMFADHCCAEYRIPTTGRGRQVEEWKLRPERPDNHWWDGIVGCFVAASMQGAGAAPVTRPAPRARVSFSDLQKRRHTVSR